MFVPQYSYLIGENLAELEPEVANYCQAIAQYKQGAAFNYTSIVRQGILNLLGRGQKPYLLAGEAYNEEKMLPFHREANDRNGLHYFHFHKLLLCYLFGKKELALENAKAAEQYLDAVTGMLNVPTFYFYNALTRLAVCSGDKDLDAEHLEVVERDRSILQKWARHAPMNFAHKLALVDAERFRVLGEETQAMEMYDRAVAGAKENGYIQERALANELAVKFYLNWGKEKIARAYMTDAYYGYARWGAKAKVEDLEKRYPHLLTAIREQPQFSFYSSSTVNLFSTQTVQSNTTNSTSSILDVSSTIKASQALSEEIELEALLCKLMQIVLENAGADGGALVLNNSGTWEVGVRGADKQCFLSATPVEEENFLPVSVVNWVKRTQKVVLINDVAKDTHFAADVYLMQQQPKSLFCTTVRDRGKFVGILYLENNLAAGAFTPDRVEVLNLLCSQAAISIENARLYRQAKQALADLQEAQLQLVQNEKMAAVGQLVAGIAHEINNPVGFISGNLDYASEYTQKLIEILGLYQQEFAEPSEAIQEKIEEIELDYLLEDLPELIQSMKEGTNRIAEISKSMRTFSRSDTDSKVLFNLQDGIDSTLLILKHRLKANENRPEIEVVKNHGSLAEVNCYPGQLNQVFMNLIANAIDALEEANNGRGFEEIKNQPNRITITTEIDGKKQEAVVRIGDNGPGMSEEVKEKIFDHLFTTKGVGKGTGLGLSISRQIVVEKHGGSLTCNSELGKGTEFAIALPL